MSQKAGYELPRTPVDQHMVDRLSLRTRQQPVLKMMSKNSSDPEYVKAKKNELMALAKKVELCHLSNYQLKLVETLAMNRVARKMYGDNAYVFPDDDLLDEIERNDDDDFGWIRMTGFLDEYMRLAELCGGDVIVFGPNTHHTLVNPLASVFAGLTEERFKQIKEASSGDIQFKEALDISTGGTMTFRTERKSSK